MRGRQERRLAWAKALLGVEHVPPAWVRVLDLAIAQADWEIADARDEAWQKSRCGTRAEYGICNRRRGHRGNHIVRMGGRFGFAWTPEGEAVGYTHDREGTETR